MDKQQEEVIALLALAVEGAIKKNEEAGIIPVTSVERSIFDVLEMAFSSGIISLGAKSLVTVDEIKET